MKRMVNRNAPIIDMTPEGRFVERPGPNLGQIITRLAIFGVVLGVAGIMFWALLLALPVFIIAGVVGYLVLRHRLRRGGINFQRGYAPLRGRPWPSPR